MVPDFHVFLHYSATLEHHNRHNFQLIKKRLHKVATTTLSNNYYKFLAYWMTQSSDLFAPVMIPKPKTESGEKWICIFILLNVPVKHNTVLQEAIF